MSDRPSLRENFRRLFDVERGLATMYHHLPWTHRLMQALWLSLLTVLSASIAYGLGLALHAEQAFWAPLTAVAVTQQSYMETRTSSRDQLIGAFVGSVAGFSARLALGDMYIAYPMAIVASITTCWLFRLGNAARLSCITPTIIMLVPYTGSFWLIALLRIAQVALGIASAMVVVSVAERVQQWWIRPAE
ncbi:FUSC family protein [Dyella japonica]|uniref:Uncharacterized membrane protein YgaE (UPF0421/DUF939 family) n=1 Tax=Dyella japonica TaxID=231455 RepID=A0ABV2JXU2_9GAMM